jgi:hypothetical protein
MEECVPGLIEVLSSNMFKFNFSQDIQTGQRLEVLRATLKLEAI